jgi:hypothetical protein
MRAARREGGYTLLTQAGRWEVWRDRDDLVVYSSLRRRDAEWWLERLVEYCAGCREAPGFQGKGF